MRLRWSTATEYVEVYEHRFVTGAPEGTHVHHIDRDRANNDPGNLRPLTPEEHRAEHRHGEGRIDGDEAERLYLLGYGTQVIGKMLGADPSAVWRNLKRRGVTTRPSKGGGPKRK